jgi:outer membrane protein
MSPANKSFRILAGSASLILLVASLAGAAQTTLKECLDQALLNNPSLKVSRNDTLIQAENVSQAASSYYPRVDLQAGYTVLLDPQAIKTNGGTFETQQPDYAFASLSIYQTIYDFGRRDRRKEQASLLEGSIASNYSATKKDVSLQVINGYYSVLHQLRLVDAAKDEVAQTEQHLKIATALYEEGATTRNDLLQAGVKLSASRQKLLAAGNQLNNNWLQLNYLTGNAPENRATLSEESEIEEPRLDKDKPSLEKRDEIAAQKSAVRAGESLVEESRREFYPELFLKAGVDYLQNSKVVEQTMAAATVGIKVNLFDGMATTSRQRQAVKLLEKEKDRLRNLEEALLLDVHIARNDLAVASERIKMTKSAITQSEENLRINNDRYKAQVGTATEVIDAQTLLSQARSDHYQALFDLQVARARVRRATGEL